jgi:hypothetical protein
MNAQYFKDYYINNKTELLAYQKEYKQRYKEQIAEQRKEHYKQNRDKILAYNKKWRENEKLENNLNK